MNDIPQWQVNLLDRLPRPVAVVTILIAGIVAEIFLLLGGGGWILVMGFFWFFGVPVIVGVVRQSVIDGIAFYVVNAVCGLIVMYSIGFLVSLYMAVDDGLPKREKKSDED